MLQIHIKDFLLVVLPILTAILSSFLTYIFSTREKKLDTVRKFKEEKYTNLILLLQSFMYSTVSSNGKKKFFEENYKSWLYCSDNVTRAINDFVNFFSGKPGLINDTKDGHELIGKIILEMRKDLLGKTKLNISDFKYIDVV
jgi:hypothetical protein